MGKSAKFMRVSSHEKAKRVQKGGTWKESGIKLARKEHKREKAKERAGLVFGSSNNSSAGGLGSGVKAGPFATSGPGLNYSTKQQQGSVSTQNMKNKSSKSTSSGPSPFAGLAQQLWSEYKDNNGNGKTSSDVPMSGKEAKVKATQNKKVKIGKNLKLKGL